MADAYDFQIESMKFRLATSDNFPYVRGTAPFRKEQFDSSPTVGDQSLTGWWTRGQLSFHKGAGLSYYEVLEDEAVLNRYTDSQNVEVFDALGEVTLDIEPANLVAAPNALKKFAPAPPNTSYLVNGVTGYFKSSHSAEPTALTMDGTTNPEDVAVVGEYAYFPTAAKNIQRFWQTTYMSTVYSHTENLYAIWAFKSRLWIVDALGDVYVVAPVPSGALPVALASPICRLPYTPGDTVTFTDSGGAVFASTSRGEIYAFTPATDGAVAALSAPVVAGVLPPEELVRAVRAHMGVLVIVTSRGVRFAAISGSELTIGPKVIDWYDSSCVQIGVVDNSVFVTSIEWSDLDTVGYEFDLTDPIEPGTLKFPYREAWRFAAGMAPSPSGACEYQGGLVWFSEGFSENANVKTTFISTLQSTGYITTAYHRFGTLDPKRFQKVTVRAKGAGTIQVYEVTADGTETSLGTMNAVDGSGTFDFTTTGPVERMALKFLLTRDGADTTLGPTLLGYQIKALPVPERQRILKVPLLLTDELTLRRGTRVGHKGKAYEDAKALEALESSTAIVTFTDHRTGETGSAYIDSVDFQGDKPSSENSNGFGGIAYATLRVLS